MARLFTVWRTGKLRIIQKFIPNDLPALRILIDSSNYRGGWQPSWTKTSSFILTLSWWWYFVCPPLIPTPVYSVEKMPHCGITQDPLLTLSGIGKVSQLLRLLPKWEKLSLVRLASLQLNLLTENDRAWLHVFCLQNRKVQSFTDAKYIKLL